MKNLQAVNMDRQQKVCIIALCTAALIGHAASSKRESRTGGLHIPEKIIGGVIDIVQSHKNKPIPGAQPTYPPNPQYNYQQYPQYQQWNGQSNFQNQGLQPQQQFQGQYQNQGQYSYQNGYNQVKYPQDGGNYNNVNPAGSGQSFSQGNQQGQYQQGQYHQGQYQQGQYQGGYQNPNQFTQPNNQFQNTQSGYYNGQSNQLQGSTTNFQQSGQTQGQASGSGQFSQGQGFMVSGGQAGGNGQGPTCVCQAWTKPLAQGQEVFADPPVAEKIEKKDDAMA